VKLYVSRFLKGVALGYMAFPVAYLAIVAILFDLPARHCVSILLSPSYYLLSALAMAVGYGLWEARRWSWYLFVASGPVVVYWTAGLVADRSATQNKWWAFLFAFSLFLMLIWRVTRELRVPYFLPRIRWWESNPRYRLAIPARIFRGKAEGSPRGSQDAAPETGVEGMILDLAAQGCFIKTRAVFEPDEAVSVRFLVFGLAFDCEGEVVWRPSGSVTYPTGVGVKFGVLSRAQRRGLRAVEKRLRKIGRFYSASRYLMNPEEFSRRMAELSAIDLGRR
jgi:hypothetical protein